MRVSLAALYPFRYLTWKVRAYPNQPEKKDQVEKLCHNWLDTHPNLKERGVADGKVAYVPPAPQSTKIVVGQHTSLTRTLQIMVTLEMYTEQGIFVTKHHVPVPEE